MELLIPVALNTVLTILFYFAEKHPRFRALPRMVQQGVIGVCFGCVSIFASEFGVKLLSTIINVRDTAPITAGLIFGGPAGVLAGLMGGLYRWFSVYWGAGMYTRLACTVATILAGVAAAGMRRLMFDSRKPTWGYGVGITAVCEVLHMLLIFLTNLHDASYAFEFVREASIPMILGNAFAVGIALIIVSLFSRERLVHRRGHENIAQTFQRWLLVCILLAYAITSLATFSVQSNMARNETRELFTTSINDVRKDIQGKSDAKLLDTARHIRESYLAQPEKPLAQLAAEHGVTEINIVAADGLITASTEDGLAGSFNMNSTEQSSVFMELTRGVESIVQAYGPVGSDGVTMRKFAGLPLPGGGYIQVGYNAEQFRDALDDFVVDVTKNRHVGTIGFIAVCDENLNMITDDEYNGLHLSTIGIIPNEEMLAGQISSQLYYTDVVNGVNNYQAEYVYVFAFEEGYCIVAAMPVREAMLMRDAAMYTSVFMQILIFAALFVFIFFLIKKVIINNLQKINQTLGQITSGNLNVKVDVRTSTEFSSLSDDINTTVATLKRYIAEAAARIDQELEYAKQIQLSALPVSFPACEDCAIEARMLAAKEVGGDFYDFYRLNDDTVAFLIADVSGKGIPAAMFMMRAKTIIKGLAERGLPVHEILTLANEQLCENNESGMFVTAWMGILELSTGRLQYANAGHNPPLLLRQGGQFEYLKSRPGLFLAGMEGIRYRMGELQLNAGDRIFLYTDGVTEATDMAQQLYGEPRLLSFMNAHAHAPACELLPALKEDIDAFAGEAPQFDDITMLMMDFRLTAASRG